MQLRSLFLFCPSNVRAFGQMSEQHMTTRPSAFFYHTDDAVNSERTEMTSVMIEKTLKYKNVWRIEDLRNVVNETRRITTTISSITYFESGQ